MSDNSQLLMASEANEGPSRSADAILAEALPQLVIPNPRTGQWQIVASAKTGNGTDENYATPFGRDSLYFMLGLIDACECERSILNHSSSQYMQKSITALEEIESYQATADNPETGARKGQMPHELRFPEDPKYKEFKHANWSIYNSGAENEYMANHDSSESTQLYILDVMRLEQLFPGFASESGRREKFRLACGYMLTNSRIHNGLAGFTNDLPWKYLEGDSVAYGGLTERDHPHLPNTWRTSNGLSYREMRDEGAHCFPNGLMPMPGYPISGLQTTALKWAAERMAADYFERTGDRAYARALREDAARTKQKFNCETHGLLRRDENGIPYFVEARGINPETRKNEQLPYITSSPLYALSYPYAHPDGRIECVIDEQYIPHVRDRLMGELFRKGFGIATYSPNQEIPAPKGKQATNYWISAGRTAWNPDLWQAATGLARFGYVDDALKIAATGYSIISRFGSMVENWVIDDDGNIARWRLPGNHGHAAQVSGSTMAFAVGGELSLDAVIKKSMELDCTPPRPAGHPRPLPKADASFLI